jgi:hypothetical protein
MLRVLFHLVRPVMILGAFACALSLIFLLRLVHGFSPILLGPVFGLLSCPWAYYSAGKNPLVRASVPRSYMLVGWLVLALWALVCLATMSAFREFMLNRADTLLRASWWVAGFAVVVLVATLAAVRLKRRWA